MTTSRISDYFPGHNGEVLEIIVDFDEKTYACSAKKTKSWKDATGTILTQCELLQPFEGFKSLITVKPDHILSSRLHRNCAVCDGGQKVMWTKDDPVWPLYFFRLHGLMTRSTQPITRQYMLNHGIAFEDIAVLDGLSMNFDDDGEPYMYVADDNFYDNWTEDQDPNEDLTP